MEGHPFEMVLTCIVQSQRPSKKSIIMRMHTARQLSDVGQKVLLRLRTMIWTHEINLVTTFFITWFALARLTPPSSGAPKRRLEERRCTHALRMAAIAAPVADCGAVEMHMLRPNYMSATCLSLIV